MQYSCTININICGNLAIKCKVPTMYRYGSNSYPWLSSSISVSFIFIFICINWIIIGWY